MVDGEGSDGPSPARGPRLTRRQLLLGATGCVACALGGFATGRRSQPAAPADRVIRTTNAVSRLAAQPDAVGRITTSEPVVALSFDDGPDPDYTPKVLEILDHYGATATFFLVGSNIAAHPSLALDVAGAGHSCANHTYDHPNLETLAPAQIQDEITRCEQAFAAAPLPRPTLFRPPYGFTDHTVDVLAAAARYRTIFWDAAVEHYVDHMDRAAAVHALLGQISPGSIILAHDGGTIAGTSHQPLDRTRTVRALPALLEGLQQRGLKVVDIPTLLHHEQSRLRARPQLPPR